MGDSPTVYIHVYWMRKDDELGKGTLWSADFPVSLPSQYC